MEGRSTTLFFASVMIDWTMRAHTAMRMPPKARATHTESFTCVKTDANSVMITTLGVISPKVATMAPRTPRLR